MTAMNQETFLSRLEWRFATKKFAADKPVSDDDFRQILKAVRLAPTSYGLQPFHVVVVRDKKLRGQLKQCSFGQPQIDEASHLLVFCLRTDMLKRIDAYVELASGGDETRRKRMEQVRDIMRSGLGTKSEPEIMAWSARQTYIALGFALAACAELGVDACPIEGCSPSDVDAALGLPDYLKSICLLAIGHRAEEPTREKVRFSDADIFSER